MALNLSDLVAGGIEMVRDRAMIELENTGRFGPFEQEIVRRNGSVYPAVIQGMRITNASGRALVWSLIEDISERKKVERMKNEFISTVSHELRTPLTSIAGSLGLVAGGALGQLPEKAERMVSIAARNSDQLKRLIDDLLDMEKLISGRMSIRMQSETVSPVIKDCIERLHTYAVDRGVSIRFRIIIHNSASWLTATGSIRPWRTCCPMPSNSRPNIPRWWLRLSSMVRISAFRFRIMVQAFQQISDPGFSRSSPRPTAPIPGAVAAPAWAWPSPVRS